LERLKRPSATKTVGLSIALYTIESWQEEIFDNPHNVTFRSSSKYSESHGETDLPKYKDWNYPTNPLEITPQIFQHAHHLHRLSHR